MDNGREMASLMEAGAARFLDHTENKSFHALVKPLKLSRT